MNSTLLRGSILAVLAGAFVIIAIFVHNQKPIRKQIEMDKTILITGISYVFEGTRNCTKVHCNCCNQCTKAIYLITNSDTIEITGKPFGQEIICKGNECKELSCLPIQIGKRYNLLGKFNENSKRKTFIAEDFKLIN